MRTDGGRHLIAEMSKIRSGSAVQEIWSGVVMATNSASSHMAVLRVELTDFHSALTGVQASLL